MEILPPQQPILPNSVQTQDAANRLVTQLQTQTAATPLLQRAVSASPKSEKGNQTRSNNDKTKGGNSGGAGTGGRGSSVNIRV